MLSAPARCRPQNLRVAGPENGHTNTRNHRHRRPWEGGSAPGNSSGGRVHPSRSQNPRWLKTQNPSLPELQRSEIAMNQSARFVPIEILHPVDVFTERSQHPILDHASSQSDRVGHAVKGNHGILRDEEFGILCLERQFHSLSKQELRIRNLISHLGKIFNRHIGNRIGVYFALILEFREHSGPVCTMSVEQLDQISAVFKSAVYPLAKEGDDGMSSIAEQQRSTFDTPRRALDRNHSTGRIRKIVVCQLRHQPEGVREALLKKTDYIRLRAETGEAFSALEWQKENARERAVDIRQRNQHVVTPRPDVKGVGLERMLPIETGRNGQLFVAVIEILLGKTEATQLEHLSPQCRGCTIAANHNLGRWSCFFSRVLVTQSDCAGFQVVANAALMEVDGRSRFLRCIHERYV